MRQKTISCMLFASLFLATGLNLTGCATTGIERATKTTGTMQTVESEYRQVGMQVDATNASLHDLINPGQTDLKRAFDRYETNVARMEKLGKELDEDSADMRAKGQSYFSEWEKQDATYANPEIKQLSEERRRELREAFARIPEASLGVKQSLNSYLADIRDIRKYLSNDLTPKGVEAITPVAEKAMQDGENLKTSIAPVLAAIERARTAIAQGGGASGTAAGGEQSEDRQSEDRQTEDRQTEEELEGDETTQERE